MRRLIIPTALVVGLLSASAWAAPIAPKGAYAIDPEHTQIVFAIRHMGISTFYGAFGKVSGTVNFDQSAPEKSGVTVQVDMHDIHTSVAELNASLPDTPFQASKFPTASFISTSVRKTGNNTGQINGNLTLAGVTKPVTLVVTFNGGRGTGEPMLAYRLGFDATAVIKRSDFRLTGMIWDGFVSDDVQLMIGAEAVRR